MRFPVFKKYNHDRTFFKIISEKEFEELNIIGSLYTLRHFESKIFSDRIFIQDMLESKSGLWIDITDEEYKNKKSYCINNLRLLDV